MEILEGLDDPQKALDNGIDPTNYAQDEEKVDRFVEQIVRLIPQVEGQRAELENRWYRYHHCWLRKNTADSRFYTGYNDAYFPVLHSNIETLVAYLVSQLFPAGPKYAIRGSSIQTPPAVIQKLTSLFDHFIYLARMQEQMTKVVRQACLYGPTVVKNVWRDESVRVYKPKIVPVQDENGQPVMDNQGQPQLQVAPVAEQMVKYRGPTFQPIDVLTFYMHPYWVDDIDDCEFVFEKLYRDIRQVRLLEGKAYLNTDKLEASENSATLPSDAGQMEANKDARSAPYGLSHGQIKNPNEVILYEIWGKFDLYGDGYLIPCKAVVCNGVVIELRQNPYWSQRPPYRLFRAIEHGDHIYGMGWAELGEHHQYTLNAIINQALDANLFQTNQFIAINMDRYQGSLSDFQMVPLGIAPFDSAGPVADAIMFHKPENTAADAFAVANIVAGSLSDSFGTPPVVSGKFTNKERTAREVSAVAEGASLRIDATAERLGREIMQRWMEDTFFHLQQFCPDELDFKITGMPPIHLTRDDVAEMPFFQWLIAGEAEVYQQQMAMQQQAQMEQEKAMAEAHMDNNTPQGNPTGTQTPTNPEGMGAQTMDNAGGPG